MSTSTVDTREENISHIGQGKVDGFPIGGMEMVVLMAPSPSSLWGGQNKSPRPNYNILDHSNINVVSAGLSNV